MKTFVFQFIVILILLYVGIMIFNLTSYPFIGILVSIAFPCYLAHKYISKEVEELKDES